MEMVMRTIAERRSDVVKLRAEMDCFTNNKETLKRTDVLFAALDESIDVIEELQAMVDLSNEPVDDL